MKSCTLSSIYHHASKRIITRSQQQQQQQQRLITQFKTPLITTASVFTSSKVFSSSSLISQRSFSTSASQFLHINPFKQQQQQQQQQDSEHDTFEDRPIAKALFVAGELASRGDIEQLTHLLAQFLDTHNTPQSHIFHYELADIESEHLESIISHVEKVGGAIPVHKAYHSLSELMTLVNRDKEAQYFTDKSLDHIRRKGFDEKNYKDRVQHALYQLKRASYFSDEEKKIQSYKAYLKEIGAHINSQNGHLVAKVYYELAGHMINNGQIKESIPDLEKAFSICEGYYGWIDPLTSRIAVVLARIYLDMNRIDFGIILAEKALIAFELFPTMFELEELLQMGIYLARAYERKKYFPYQQATITRTFNLLKRRKDTEDAQLYQECVFRLENMLASSKYLQGDYVLSFTILKKLNDLVNADDQSFLNAWKQRDEVEATLEYAFMKYFRGATLVRTGDIASGIESLLESREAFVQLEREDWVQRVDLNITEAEQQMTKPPPPASH